MANPYFNATYYLTKNPDVFAAGINTVEGAWNHYLQFGAAEALDGAGSRSPAPWFDVLYYLNQNPDLTVAGLTPGEVFEHFVTHGIREGRAPSATANVNEATLTAYAAANEDLRDAFGIDDVADITEDQFTQLAQHFYQYGYKEDRAAKPSEPVTPAETEFLLSAANDNLKGTDAADTFLAFISQNPMMGGVSNTLSSGDRIDGGAGTDYLFAEIVPEFIGSGEYDIDIQPRTVSVENIEFEARDLSVNGGFTVSVDAKHMYGVERIGSKQSDGDLVIENLTTLANDGVTKRNTSELTITMDHTDNTNSDGDPSDLKVYFDDNYLVAGKQSEGVASYFLLDMDAEEQGLPPLNHINVDGVRFRIGEDDTIITLRADGAYEADTHVEFVAALQEALNELIADGSVPAGTTLVVDPSVTRVYKHPDTGNDLPAVPAIVLTSGDGSKVSPVGFQQVQDLPGEFAVLGRFESEHNLENEPVSVNIELTKVGRGWDGGDLIIGAKSQHNGIEQFDVTVMGGDHLPNSLGTLATTGGKLKTVNIASEEILGREKFASLEIRDGFGHNLGQHELARVDASAFRGDLMLGTDDAVQNLRVLNATGGGNVTYEAVVGEGYDVAGMPSLGDLNFSAVTAGGNDTFDLDITNGAQMTVNSGDGNDKLEADITGTTNSGSKSSSLTFTATGGNNVVTVSGGDNNWANVTTGGGADVVTGGGVDLTASTGAGNDVIYAENTGDKATVVLAAGGSAFNDDTALVINGVAVKEFELLHGRDVVVTLGLPGMDPAAFGEDGLEVSIEVRASEGFLTTERDLYQAVANAINGDAVLNKIAKAEVTSSGHLIVEYLVDGATNPGDQLIEIEIEDTWADLTNAQKAGIVGALKAKYRDSTLVEANVEAAYDALDGNLDYIVVTGVAAEFTVDLAGLVATATSGDELTFTINGHTATLTEGTNFTGQATATALANELDGNTITIDGITYTIAAVDVASSEITLTADTPADVGDEITVTDEAGPTTVTGNATIPGVDPTGSGTNSTTFGENTVNGGAGDDVIVLSSNAVTEDVIKFDAGDFGNDTIVHFTAGNGAGADVLDFTKWLSNVTSASGSVESQIRIDTDVVTTGPGAITANDVVIVDFTDLALDPAITFDSMTNAQVLSALNTAGGFTVGAADPDLVGTVQNSLLMVQNLDNEGEYKVFQVTSTDVAGENFTAATLVGSLDFGTEQAWNLVNFA